jgi:hypothetical protein
LFFEQVVVFKQVVSGLFFEQVVVFKQVVLFEKVNVDCIRRILTVGKPGESIEEK